MSTSDSLKQCADLIEWQLKEKGFEPGAYQAQWREFFVNTNQDIEYDSRDCMLAILDALIHQGSVAAWSGDGTACVQQMIEFAYKRRDYWRKRALEAEKLAAEYKEKAWMYDDLCK